ncbi:AmmeMemoRadiSam system protein B, partial [Patescibacteria group bacterium]|nr:AmmeMemoRadiSam system protein B [Patescibacteria group bacterium]
MFKPTFRIIALIITILVIIESMFVIGWILGAEGKPSVFSMANIGQSSKSDVIFSTDQYTQSLYDWAYGKADDVDHVESKSAIVAHHLVVADEIAKVFETIGSREADTVIILSPNHFAQGVSPLQTTYGSWKTYYGNVEADSDLIDELADDLDVLRIEDNTFENEHGVSSIVPFVAKSFPDAKLVPL